MEYLPHRVGDAAGSVEVAAAFALCGLLKAVVDPPLEAGERPSETTAGRPSATFVVPGGSAE